MLSEACMRGARGVAITFVTAFTLWAGGPKKPAVATGGNELVELTATVIQEKEAVKELLGSDLGGHYIILQMNVRPRAGKEITIQRDDFLLRTDRDGDKSTPFAPSQIAGKGVLVVSESGGGGGIMGDAGGPMWGGYPGGPPVMMGGGGVSMGGDGEGESTKATMKSGGKDSDSPLMKVLKAKILPEKKTDQPVSGLLYFPMEKQKVKDLELIYTTPSGKISMRFR